MHFKLQRTSTHVCSTSVRSSCVVDGALPCHSRCQCSPFKLSGRLTDLTSASAACALAFVVPSPLVLRRKCVQTAESAERVAALPVVPPSSTPLLLPAALPSPGPLSCEIVVPGDKTGDSLMQFILDHCKALGVLDPAICRDARDCAVAVRDMQLKGCVEGTPRVNRADGCFGFRMARPVGGHPNVTFEMVFQPPTSEAVEEYRGAVFL